MRNEMTKDLYLRLLSAVLVVGAIVLLAAGPVEAQCALCQSALIDSPEGQQMASGLNAAILLLLAAPYMVFGTLAGSIWWSRRRRRSAEG